MRSIRNTCGTRCALVVAVALALAMPALLTAQDLHPSRRPSPMGMARTFIDDDYVRVVYSRPYKRDRDNIFGTKAAGALVPDGELWRFGANEATEITVTGDVMVGGKRLPAGTYSLFVTPAAEHWTFHFNKELGLSGSFRQDPKSGEFVDVYDTANDVVTASAPRTTLDEEVDQLTIGFDASDGGADMVVRWITTEVRLPFKRVDS